ncbi:hypothetical protein Cadr_000005215 [Camelus dromedarius]|uniref:Uncharacterized protein n=1 Tax=Camelus dromedarius TaxID=9838 RepID=A0A5N4E210_CAMDR|nr:hypothetical protein Cadr_000005215 [Camelus dromedarius]
MVHGAPGTHSLVGARPNTPALGWPQGLRLSCKDASAWWAGPSLAHLGSVIPLVTLDSPEARLPLPSGGRNELFPQDATSATLPLPVWPTSTPPSRPLSKGTSSWKLLSSLLRYRLRLLGSITPGLGQGSMWKLAGREGQARRPPPQASSLSYSEPSLQASTPMGCSLGFPEGGCLWYTLGLMEPPGHAGRWALLRSLSPLDLPCPALLPNEKYQLWDPRALSILQEGSGARGARLGHFFPTCGQTKALAQPSWGQSGQCRASWTLQPGWGSCGCPACRPGTWGLVLELNRPKSLGEGLAKGQNIASRPTGQQLPRPPLPHGLVRRGVVNCIHVGRRRSPERSVMLPQRCPPSPLMGACVHRAGGGWEGDHESWDGGGRQRQARQRKSVEQEPTAARAGSRRGPGSVPEARQTPKTVPGPGPNFHIEGLGRLHFEPPEASQPKHRWEAEARISSEGPGEKADSCADRGRWGGCRRGAQAGGSSKRLQTDGAPSLVLVGAGCSCGVGRKSPALAARLGLMALPALNRNPVLIHLRCPKRKRQSGGRSSDGGGRPAKATEMDYEVGQGEPAEPRPPLQVLLLNRESSMGHTERSSETGGMEKSRTGTWILREKRICLAVSAGHSKLPSHSPWLVLPAPLQGRGHGCPISVSHSMFPSQGPSPTPHLAHHSELPTPARPHGPVLVGFLAPSAPFVYLVPVKAAGRQELGHCRASGDARETWLNKWKGGWQGRWGFRGLSDLASTILPSRSKTLVNTVQRRSGGTPAPHRHRPTQPLLDPWDSPLFHLTSALQVWRRTGDEDVRQTHHHQRGAWREHSGLKRLCLWVTTLTPISVILSPHSGLPQLPQEVCAAQCNRSSLSLGHMQQEQSSGFHAVAQAATQMHTCSHPDTVIKFPAHTPASQGLSLERHLWRGRERFEDATLLTLKMEEGARRQGMQAASLEA